MCIHIKYNTRPLCRPISFDYLHVSLFWILRVTYISYANNPVSLLPLLPVYGVSNGLLFGISGYKWIEILISINHYNISKSTYPLSENQITEPVGACGLGPVWYQGIGIHHGGRWQPVPKQFTSLFTLNTMPDGSHWNMFYITNYIGWQIVWTK